jgi:hypothetical protein
MKSYSPDSECSTPDLAIFDSNMAFESMDDVEEISTADVILDFTKNYDDPLKFAITKMNITASLFKKVDQVYSTPFIWALNETPELDKVVSDLKNLKFESNLIHDEQPKENIFSSSVKAEKFNDIVPEARNKRKRKSLPSAKTNKVKGKGKKSKREMKLSRKRTSDTESSRSRTRLFQCEYCGEFFSAHGLGGHKATKHRGMQSNYSRSQKIRKQNEETRLIRDCARLRFSEQYGEFKKAKDIPRRTWDKLKKEVAEDTQLKERLAKQLESDLELKKKNKRQKKEEQEAEKE